MGLDMRTPDEARLQPRRISGPWPVPRGSMTPWTLLESASIPGNGGELRLYQRCKEFSITLVGRGELMSSRVHGSEEALGELACARVAGRAQPRVLIGGLGMGFTLAAALKALGPTAEVVVAELVPEVVQWNRESPGRACGASAARCPRHGSRRRRRPYPEEGAPGLRCHRAGCR